MEQERDPGSVLCHHPGTHRRGGTCPRPAARDETLYDLAELFKIFGDSTRVKILYALLESELCVCDIAKLMDVSQSAVSHQLRVLKASKLVKFRREGKTIYYSLADNHVVSILNQGMEHIEEE